MLSGGYKNADRANEAGSAIDERATAGLRPHAMVRQGPMDGAFSSIKSIVKTPARACMLCVVGVNVMTVINEMHCVGIDLRIRDQLSVCRLCYVT